MRLNRFIQSIREDHPARWVTFWQVPGRGLFRSENEHHESMAVRLEPDLPRKGLDPEDEAMALGWVRGGFYASVIDKIYMSFDEEEARKSDVNAVLTALRKEFKAQTGQWPDSVYTSSGEIALRDFPLVTSHLKESYLGDIPIMEATSSKDFGPIMERARSLGFNGFGGNCGLAAIAINRVLFGGRGKLVVAVNRFHRSHGHWIGHIAVKSQGRYYDADGYPKALEDIESWGMLDPEDPDYQKPGWSDEAAEQVDVFEVTESTIIDQFGYTGDQIDQYVEILTRAVSA